MPLPAIYMYVANHRQLLTSERDDIESLSFDVICTPSKAAPSWICTPSLPVMTSDPEADSRLRSAFGCEEICRVSSGPFRTTPNDPLTSIWAAPTVMTSSLTDRDGVEPVGDDT